MRNPWQHIPQAAPFVLPDDRSYIDAYNARETKLDHFVNLNYTPEPRLGPIDAPVVLLQLNPSYDAAHPEGHPNFEDSHRHLESLKDEFHPHVGLVPGEAWWQRCLGALVSAVGNRAQVARCLCSIEFFPYRSRKFSHGQIRLPSQSYTFELVRAAIDRGAIFVVARNFRLWLAAVPELLPLQGAHRLYVLKSARRISLSEKTLPDRAFAQIVDVVKSCSDRGKSSENT